MAAFPREAHCKYESGLKSDIGPCPKSAKKRLVRRSKSTSLFDHLVGAGQQRRWHDDAKRLCGLQIDNQLELRGLLNG